MTFPTAKILPITSHLVRWMGSKKKSNCVEIASCSSWNCPGLAGEPGVGSAVLTGGPLEDSWRTPWSAHPQAWLHSATTWWPVCGPAELYLGPIGTQCPHPISMSRGMGTYPVTPDASNGLFISLGSPAGRWDCRAAPLREEQRAVSLVTTGFPVCRNGPHPL